MSVIAFACVGCACEGSPLGDAGSDDAAIDAGLADGGPPDGGTDAAPDAERVYPPFCDPPLSPPEVLVPMGDDATSLRPDGRALTPAGPQVELGGFPLVVRVHPSLPIAYVMNAGYGGRSVQVVDLAARAIVQQIDWPELFHGLALAPDGATTSGPRGC
jgi:hypothetical protein